MKPEEIKDKIFDSINEALSEFHGKVINETTVRLVEEKVTQVLYTLCPELQHTTSVEVNVKDNNNGTISIIPANLFTGLLFLVQSEHLKYEQIVPFIHQTKCEIDGVSYEITNSGLKIKLQAPLKYVSVEFNLPEE